MSELLHHVTSSYLRYARGERESVFWSFLWPFQFVVRAGARLRGMFYTRGIFAVDDPVLPTVSIGNNSLGGTNKTPMVEYMVRLFAQAGIRAGVVSRGYHAQAHTALWIGQDERSLTRDFAGDEPLMLARRLSDSSLPDTKVVVSVRRFEGVKLLASLGIEVAVTDDTFQHRKMARDVDIVLVDALCPFGNGGVIPAGLMREPKSAFSRADIIVITKANQTRTIESLRRELERYVAPDKIFAADMVFEKWLPSKPSGKCLAFSAIGSPDEFYTFLDGLGVNVAQKRTFRDHHTLTDAEIAKLNEAADEYNIDCFCCTEKDLTNIDRSKLSRPLCVPSIVISMREEERFLRAVARALRPAFLVASNGHGEDAIGVVLAKKLISRFPQARVDAFAFVGSGKQYTACGINVLSPMAEMPSGGVIKYDARDLIGDMRHGLGASIGAQHRTLRQIARHYRTPLCVGDVYLLASVLWCHGLKPVLVATAKTVFLSGHLMIEKFLLKKRALLTWTRDEETAQDLIKSGVSALFDGNPIMDLLDEAKEPSFLWSKEGSNILLLPGSRPRAYDDVKLVLDVARLLAQRERCNFVMVVAPTLDVKKMNFRAGEWTLKDDKLLCGSIEVILCRKPVASAAYGADLLIGLGGTANQLCAGHGIPVVSLKETGKLRQKKLLRDAEILVDANAESLADAAERILNDENLRKSMQEAGIKNLGRTGALDSVVDYCDNTLGWGVRCRVYEKYKKFLAERLDKEMRDAE